MLSLSGVKFQYPSRPAAVLEAVDLCLAKVLQSEKADRHLHSYRSSSCEFLSLLPTSLHLSNLCPLLFIFL